MITWKVIKPTAMKQDEMRLAMLTMVHKAAREIKKDFIKTTDTWEHKPKFEEMISLKGGPSVFVGTDDEIYNWVNNGTKLHNIYPVNYPYLYFEEGFKPKTTPGVIGSVQGGKFGPKHKHGPVQQHIEVRHFDEDIQDDWKDKFKCMVEEVMREAAQKSGHGRR